MPLKQPSALWLCDVSAAGCHRRQGTSRWQGKLMWSCAAFGQNVCWKRNIGNWFVVFLDRKFVTVFVDVIWPFNLRRTHPFVYIAHSIYSREMCEWIRWGLFRIQERLIFLCSFVIILVLVLSIFLTFNSHIIPGFRTYLFKFIWTTVVKLYAFI